jgi:hypothetical protein
LLEQPPDFGDYLMVVLLDSLVRSGQAFMLRRLPVVDGGPPLVRLLPLSFHRLSTQGEFMGVNALLFLPHGLGMRIQCVERISQRVSEVVERGRCCPQLLSPFVVVESPGSYIILPAAVLTVHLLLYGLTHIVSAGLLRPSLRP